MLNVAASSKRFNSFLSKWRRRADNYGFNCDAKAFRAYMVWPWIHKYVLIIAQSSVGVQGEFNGLCLHKSYMSKKKNLYQFNSGFPLCKKDAGLYRSITKTLQNSKCPLEKFHFDPRRLSHIVTKGDHIKSSAQDTAKPVSSDYFHVSTSCLSQVDTMSSILLLM